MISLSVTPEILEKISNALKDSLFNYCASRKPMVKETSNYVYGKEVCMFKNIGENDFKDERFPLETWLISIDLSFPSLNQLPIEPLASFQEEIDSLMLPIRPEIEKFEFKKFKEKMNGSLHPDDYVVHQLCSWTFLTDEEGYIFNHPRKPFEVNIVKYAVVLPKEYNS